MQPRAILIFFVVCAMGIITGQASGMTIGTDAAGIMTGGTFILASVAAWIARTAGGQ